MIDFGLTKMMLIGAVALVVIGPEKLPKVARMAGSLFGRAQRYINDVKAEVSREMEFDELRRMHEDVKQAANAVGNSIADAGNELNAAWVGERPSASSYHAPSADLAARKLRNFRKKKLARGAIPIWYKQQTGHKTRVVSAAARVARFRPGGFAGKSTFFHQ
jgi:sec-independent protein translocase protein TatB